MAQEAHGKAQASKTAENDTLAAPQKVEGWARFW
jgi:hypothetical protein